jgi:hypothetical protein
VDSIVLGSVPFDTAEDSWQISYGGGTTLARSNSGRAIGQRSNREITGVSGGIVPLLATDRAVLERLLAFPGVLPLRLPDGTILAVQPPDEGHAAQGLHANDTDTYPTQWRVRHDAVLADVFFRGALGAQAYRTVAYVTAGSNTLLADTGRRINGSGSWNLAYLAEGVATAPRPQPTLVAEWTPSADGECAIGWTTAPSPGHPLGLHGVGVLWQDGLLRSMGYGDVVEPNGYSLIGVPDPTLVVVVIARPVAARVEVWQNGTRIYVDTAVPWTMPATPLRAMASVRRGTAMLARWWATRG